MLHIHRSERADALVAALAEILAESPSDPFARELVAVPTRGMERWLTQRLSGRLGAQAGHADGVCAAVDFPSPSRLMLEALATASGVDPGRDPWNAERSVWPLIEVTDELLDEPWLAPLAVHLAGGHGRRYLRLRHLAGLYEHYALHRPEMILAWATGSDTTGSRPRGAESDALGWQPELWRRLRERVAVPSAPERLATAQERLGADPGLVPLPQRLCFFGLTRIAPAHLALLGTLSQSREVHLMLLHPSPALWDAVARAGLSGPVRRAEDRSGELARHRLLGSWGRDARELQLLLAGTGATEARHRTVEAAPEPPRTLLAAIQADIRADRPPPGPPLVPGAPDGRLSLNPGDASVRVHACHGRARQVAVLREAIMHRLAADPTLEPRDIIVMCPDVEEFAPLVQGAFGAGEAAAGELRVRLADRGLGQTNPLLGLAARLVELASARLTASEVLDLLDAAPVRRRFDLSGDDVSRLRSWVVEARIHWGLDAPHRRRWKLDGVDAGTWARGLNRLLLSAAVSDSGARPFGATLPAAQIDSADIGLVGTLAEFVERLGVAIGALGGPHSLDGWVDALSSAVGLLATVAPEDIWQRRELDELLGEVLADGGGRASLRLSQTEARALLAERLRGRPTRANFRTGHLTVCTLHPMRSVPHRIVCLLGLDDRAFPRGAPRDGDDLLAADPWVGDRDGRSEDRQLLLDALMAAEEALIITFSGNDERTNAPLPPAVPVGELLDTVDATAGPTLASPSVSGLGSPESPAASGPGWPASHAVLVRHPLQAFDPRNFAAGALGVEGPWSFDRVALAGARALRADATPGPGPGPFLREALDRPEVDALVALDDLVAFVERPARAFLRQRLGVSLTRWEDELTDTLPVELDPVDRHGVGQRLLEAALAGADWSAAIDAELARGTLPPGELGRPLVRDALRQARDVATQAAGFTRTEPRTFETNVALPSGRRLSGTVSGVRDRVLLSVAFSRLNPRHRLAAWVRMLALSAAHPEVPWEAVSVGRAAPGQGGVLLARIPALAGTPAARLELAHAELDRLLDLREEGLTRPFMAPSRTAEAYVSAQAARTEPADAASAEWISGWIPSGWRDREDAEPEHRLLFDGHLDLDNLARDGPRLWQELRARERIERA